MMITNVAREKVGGEENEKSNNTQEKKNNLILNVKVKEI